MDEELQALDRLFAAMPPVHAMAIRGRRWDGETLWLAAPLAANLNDKGCAFGGSLASVMTLAGWGRVVLGLRRAGREAEVYVADSQIQYLAPLHADLVGRARLAGNEDWEAVLLRLEQRGRSRVLVDAAVEDAGGNFVATMQARFAALRAGG